VLLSSLLHALYITVETVNTNRRKVKSLRNGGYRVRKADAKGSLVRETSVSVPALASRHLYTVCVCLLMMVSSQAVQPLLSSTVAAPWYLERRHKQVSRAFLLVTVRPLHTVLYCIPTRTNLSKSHHFLLGCENSICRFHSRSIIFNSFLRTLIACQPITNRVMCTEIFLLTIICLDGLLYGVTCRSK
jgi:hypothetical protein